MHAFPAHDHERTHRVASAGFALGGQDEPAAYGDGDDLSFLLATVPRYDVRD